MESNDFNQNRFNRRTQLYRLKLGLQQILNYPLLNILWIVFAAGVYALVIFIKKISANMGTLIGIPVLKSIFDSSMKIAVIIIPIICAISIIYSIGHFFAIKDESDLKTVFESKGYMKNQTTILCYKKKDRRTGVTIRQFYTSIPMSTWQKQKHAICDRMNIHLIGEITYGGKDRNNGHLIYFESAKGRKPIERGDLYDDEF